MSDHPTAPADREDALGAPLPPLPDGGLAESMPTWLRHPRHPGDDGLPDAPPAFTGLDVSAILTDDDLPAWLTRIAERQERERLSSIVPSPDAAEVSGRSASHPDAKPQEVEVGTGSSLPPLPSSLTRPVPPTPDTLPAPPGEVKERLIAAAMAIVALIILVWIFLL